MNHAEKQLEAIREDIAAKNKRMGELLEQLEIEGEDTFTEAQEKEYKDLEAKVTLLKTRADRYEKHIQTSQDLETPVATINTKTPQIGKVEENWQKDPKCGYEKPRDFFAEVMEATVNPSKATAQLKFLATVGSDEHSTVSDSYGGYLVPEGFLPGILTTGFDVDPTAGLVTQVPMDVPTVNINARTDKNHTNSVSGGLRVYRRSETESVSSSRMQTDRVKLEAHSMMGLAYETEELLERSPSSFMALIEAGFRDEFASRMIKEKIEGTGVGEALGILNAPATISVAKEGGQSADTINVTNITKMRQRCWMYSQAIWIANHDTYLQLIAAHTAFSNTDQPIFTHGNGTDVPDTLLGRPIVFSEHAKALGDNGDIILGVWSQYLWGTLSGIRQADSMHVRFLNHERTFKFWMENDGQPWWKSALTPKNGANTLSPFVTLAERA